MSGTSKLLQSDVITVDAADHVATVWLDRPEKMNAFGRAAWDDLPRIMDALSEDPDVRVVVIAAKGKAFTVGIDLVDFGPAFMAGGVDPDAEPTSEVGRRRATYHAIKRMQGTFSSIAACTKPVIAAVHGYCLGAGIDLITACDIRLASADAVFSVRETRIAMVADVGTMQRLPAIIDPGRVAELVYTGADFPAARVHEMGLVGHVYDDREALLAAALQMAAQIAANSPLAVQGAKAVLRAGEGRSVAEALDYIAVWNAAFLHSNDLMEAVAAFVEKREPKFTGE
jgi:enoyl-CoA hydratase